MLVGSVFRRMKRFYFLYVFCLCSAVHSTSKLPFVVFFKIFGVSRVEITFTMRKGENLANQTSSKDSITMNLGKSAASFSESDSAKFYLGFFFLRRHVCNIFVAELALHYPLRSPTFVGNEPKW